MNHYPILPINKIKPWISEMERLKVSKVARSERGILTHFLKNKSLNENFIKKRNSFLSRTLVSFYRKPSYRRFLSIIAWMYMPEITNKQLADIMNK
jgi:hypothetical protein